MEPTHFESLYPPNSRLEEVKKMLTFVKEGKSCQIVSFPGVGRSNLLRLLSYNRTLRDTHLGENLKWFHFVLCDFSEIRKKPLFDATKFLFLELVDSLRERRFSEEYALANTIFKESLQFNDELVLFQGLKRTIDLLAIEKELTIVFLFDKFEEYIPMLTSEFFTNLRLLRNRAKYRFSVVFSVTRPLEESINQEDFVDFYDFAAGNTIYLPIHDEPSLLFRISYIEKVSEKNLPQNLIKEIITLTGGHGKLTRRCVEILLQENSEKNLSGFLLQNSSAQKVLVEIWSNFSPSEQKELLSIAKKEKTVPSSYLMSIGIVKQNRISIPLFQDFLLKDVTPQQETVTITFDPQTNEIKKGALIISNSLTASEFRLLRFLLENTEKTLAREEVITAVWKQDKTTMGVTDQALDQLISRLRKKIEEDPNNPTHLQTVKGRGFRFIP